jgi:AcrR family transcriptional regulator
MGIRERKERDREELRRKIILTASDLISRDGHESLTIRKLARAIEYSPRTIYLYFRDKEHLLREIVEEGFRRTLELRRGEDVKTRNSEVLLEQHLRSHIRAALSNPNFYRAVVTLLFEKNFEPGPAQQEIIQRTRDELAGVCSGGEKSESEVEALSMIVFSTIRGFSLALLNLEGRMDTERLEELIEHYISFVKRGIGEEIQ